MDMVNAITDKPDWQRKVFDETITTKWQQELKAADPEPVQPAQGQAAEEPASVNEGTNSQGK